MCEATIQINKGADAEATMDEVQITGTLITDKITRNGRHYTLASRAEKLNTLIGKTIAIEHSSNPADNVGVFNRAYMEDGKTKFIGTIFNTKRYPDVIQMMKHGLLGPLSVEIYPDMKNMKNIEEDADKKVPAHVEIEVDFYEGGAFVRHPGDIDAHVDSIIESFEPKKEEKAVDQKPDAASQTTKSLSVNDTKGNESMTDKPKIEVSKDEFEAFKQFMEAKSKSAVEPPVAPPTNPEKTNESAKPTGQGIVQTESNPADKKDNAPKEGNAMAEDTKKTDAVQKEDVQVPSKLLMETVAPHNALARENTGRQLSEINQSRFRLAYTKARNAGMSHQEAQRFLYRLVADVEEFKKYIENAE
jgi:hypothetical protein